MNDISPRYLMSIVQNINDRLFELYKAVSYTHLSLAIRQKLAEGVKSGVVWHTQGSCKTALSYYLTYILNDFYSKQNKVAKFYFISPLLQLPEAVATTTGIVGELLSLIPI